MRHRVLMVSDFFYPNAGGVETHIYQLSQCLMARGNKVVVLTHAYGDRVGVRYLTNGLKVYYVPRLPLVLQVVAPTILGSFRLVRDIILRERITLVHAHQAFSALAHEAVLHARTMGCQAVFTDHSLLGFSDFSSVVMNKLLQFTLADVHQVICVSRTSKQNTVQRAQIPPKRVYVIPNAVDATRFRPDPSQAPRHRIQIVALSRLVHRKGIDLLAVTIPEFCARHAHVDFLLGGDGPKAALLRSMVEQEGLQERVRLVGAVPHEKARDLLVQGHIFINASLTEAFCMAVVEAAAAGLLVVSTAVGGVPEVLPSSMMLLADPSPDSVLAALESALQRLPDLKPFEQHDRVASFYAWPNIAERTEVVYDISRSVRQDGSLLARLKRYHTCGSWFGKICCCLAIVEFLWWQLVQHLCPQCSTDTAPDWPLGTEPTDVAHSCQVGTR
eukprot:jgi/Astpho2/7378/fgenesh1_pm.00114_%23_10_t